MLVAGKSTVAAMACVEERGTGDPFLTDDVLRDVLDRVDGATLARASCVSTQFRCAGYEEAAWEKRCNERWPSTREERVKSLVSTVGGFRKLYNSCFPFVASNSHCGSGEEDNEGEAVSSSDFVSIVDVTYGGEPVLARVVEGVPGAMAMCGPLVDILEMERAEAGGGGGGHGGGVSKEGGDRAVVTIHTSIPRVSSIARERKDGRFWGALCSDLRLSWILVDKKTQRMVNLGSWKPLGGIRHRPCGDDFLLRFGSILPTSTPVHCNITMRCTTTTPTPAASEFEAENAATTVVRVSELGMHLEDVHGVHLRGSQAISLLSRVMSCYKTVAESEVAASYKTFVATQISNQESLIRRENHRQTAGAVFFVCVFVIVMTILV